MGMWHRGHISLFSLQKGIPYTKFHGIQIGCCSLGCSSSCSYGYIKTRCSYEVIYIYVNMEQVHMDIYIYMYIIFQLIEAIAVFLYLFIIQPAPASMNLSHFPLLDSHNATTLSNSMAELKRRIRKDDVLGTSQCWNGHEFLLSILQFCNQWIQCHTQQ